MLIRGEKGLFIVMFYVENLCWRFREKPAMVGPEIMRKLMKRGVVTFAWRKWYCDASAMSSTNTTNGNG